MHHPTRPAARHRHPLRRPARVAAALTALALLAGACSDDGGTTATVSDTAADTVVETTAPATTAAATTTPTTEAPPVATEAPPTTEPVEEPAVDLAELQTALDGAVADWLAASGAPGATLGVVLPDGTELTAVGGVADLTEGRPVATDDLFRFGSITKPMTSTLVLQLVEEGLVDLDTPVAEYLGPDWIEGYVLDGVDHAATVTVRQLLNHTDGFAEFAFDLGFYLLVSERLDVPLEPEEVIAWAGERGPQYVPGEAYAYNTVGHIVAGLLVEELTGRDAAEVMTERLFEPAGATSAYLPPTLLPPDGQGAVDGYVQGALRDALGAIPGFAPFAEAAAVGEFYDLSVAPQEVLRTAGWTGGGLEATAIDTARIVRSMFDGTALETATVEEFTTPWDGAATGYGLGISRGEFQGWTTYSHGGGVPGFRSDAVHVPDLGLTIAVSANLIEVDPDIGELSEAVLDVLVDRLAVD